MMCGVRGSLPCTNPVTVNRVCRFRGERRLCGAIAGLEWLNTSVGILWTEEVVSLDSYDAYGRFGVVGSLLVFYSFPTHLC